ncbi:hypothetical protein KI387_017176, partial [Taxus chinensis]
MLGDLVYVRSNLCLTMRKVAKDACASKKKKKKLQHFLEDSSHEDEPDFVCDELEDDTNDAGNYVVDASDDDIEPSALDDLELFNLKMVELWSGYAAGTYLQALGTNSVPGKYLGPAGTYLQCTQTIPIQVDVSICTGDKYCIEVVLRCLAVRNDGTDPCAGEDGGLLASIMEAAFKGELEHFQVGVALEVFQLDAWYIEKEGSQEAPAKFIVQGICRRCCIPELILRCMQITVSLADISDGVLENQNELIDLIASPDSELHCLFSQHQLQEFLLFEREFCIRHMEAQEDKSVDNT